MINRIPLCSFYAFTLLLLTCNTVEKPPATSAHQPPEIRGIYGSPTPLWKKGIQLRDIGVNAIFVHSGSIRPEMMQRARSEGVKVFAEFATLNGKNYVQEHPEAWAIDEKGQRVEAASWFMGVCPTEPGFRQHRFDQLRDLLTTFDLDGVWMDYVHWHAQFEEAEPILFETCFCDHCLHRFSDDQRIEIPPGTTAEKAKWILNEVAPKWRDWRCQIILEWATEMKKIVGEIRPQALLGLYHCPWTDDEFNGARRDILGLDYDLLKETIDVFSPMVYHQRSGRQPDWVEENIAWFCDRLAIQEGTFPKVWPIVQAHDSPTVVSEQDFQKVLLGGLAGCSSGVMMFTTRAVAESEAKLGVVKSVYEQVGKLESYR